MSFGDGIAGRAAGEGPGAWCARIFLLLMAVAVMGGFLFMLFGGIELDPIPNWMIIVMRAWGVAWIASAIGAMIPW